MWIKLAACALFSFVTSLTAHAADYYAGKTITFIIGSAPGGGYDIYGRTVGRHLSKHIPGRPNIVIQNMDGAS